jgi:hypothetical protein
MFLEDEIMIHKAKILFILILMMFPLGLSFSQSITQPIMSASYLGVNLGMLRSEIVDDNGNPLLTSGLEPVNMLHLLELDTSRKDIDRSIIKGKAVPFIDRIYFQFVRDPFATPIEVRADGEEIYEYKLYEILIQFNEDHIGYYELQDILTNGMDILNPAYTTGSTEPQNITYNGYGQPSSIEPQKIVWGNDQNSLVKITLTRSNKINQFGNVVRFIHKTAFEYIKDLNDPIDKPDSELVQFSDITVLGNTGTDPKLGVETIAEVGRRDYFLSLLLPQD